MRPTLIQQKSVFGQEPVAGVPPERTFSRASSIGFYCAAWLIGNLCTMRLLNCGVAHGLGRIAFRNVYFLLPWAFVLLFYFLICGPSMRPTRRSWLRLLGIPALLAGIVLALPYSWIGGAMFGGLINVLKPWKRPTRVPWIGLTGIAALLIGVYFLPQLVEGNRQPWIVTGPAPRARTNPKALPIMSGTWDGCFGGDPALLAVTRQNGEEFEGALLDRESAYTFKLAVRGRINGSGTVDIQETQVLDEPCYQGWALGSDTASFSPSALQVEGRGVDTRSHHYHWSFTHVSAAVYIPKN